MQNVQTFLCDKHPLLKMFRIEVSEEGKQEKFEVFKCPKPLCNRFYFLGENCGYVDSVGESPLKGKLSTNSDPQLRCSQHKSPLYLSTFKPNGEESLRIWRCAHGGCEEMKTTTGENYLAKPAKQDGYRDA
jgi:hypothetical protein